jgi:hypothetical protein
MQIPAQTPQVRRCPRRLIVVSILVATCAIITPVLLRLVPDAYPSEPEKQRALEMCSQVNPTFLRYLPSERETCYQRFPTLAGRKVAKLGS